MVSSTLFSMTTLLQTESNFLPTDQFQLELQDRLKSAFLGIIVLISPILNIDSISTREHFFAFVG